MVQMMNNFHYKLVGKFMKSNRDICSACRTSNPVVPASFDLYLFVFFFTNELHIGPFDLISLYKYHYM